MISQSQLPEGFRSIIDEQLRVYRQGRAITNINSIPDTQGIPIENQRHWLKIPNVICVFVDMLGSTRLGATTHDGATAGAFQLFTGTAVRLFSEFESPYVDIRGDGAFALFDSSQPYRALAAAVTFKTFSAEEFVPKILADTGVPVGCHLGIDQKTVLVRKLGFKRYRGRSDKQNEVWAGKPVNMAAKLASLTSDGELLVSDRFYQNFTDEHATLSCGCPHGNKMPLWEEVDLSQDERFDFERAFCLRSKWCRNHGKEFCEALLGLDAAAASPSYGSHRVA
jgi:class 3 adenylate cyclase